MKLEGVAFHEAGHAVIAWREQVKIKKVSIFRDVARGLHRIEGKPRQIEGKRSHPEDRP